MKRFLMNLNLSKKLLIAPMVVIAFLVISGVVYYLSLSNQKSAIEDIFGTRFKSYQSSATLIKDVTTIHANLYKVLSWANANYEAKKIEQLGQEQMKTLDAALATVNHILQTKRLTQEEGASYKAVLTLLTAYRKDVFEAIDLASSDVNYATTYMGKAEEKFQTLYRKLSELLELETKLGQVTYDGSLASFNTAIEMFIVVMLVAIVVSLLLSLLIARAIAGPVHRAIEVVQKIAKGDLTQEITLKSSDEIGTLAQSVDEMRQKMGEAVGGAVTTSQNLSEAASEQAASVEESSASLEELASMTKNTASSTAKADDLMTGVKGKIEKANTTLGQLMVSMKEIATASEQTQKIVKTIDEISFQTNLLALNAAVEAARAGEAGVGFAVVAEEVRNLALRAADEARNTSQMMTDILGKIRTGEQLAQATSQDFVQTRTSSTEVVELMGGIAKATREQSQGIEQINASILDLNRVTQQNAASAQELASIMSIFITETGVRKRV
jgi:methyl-accepting chemotaxis protein